MTSEQELTLMLLYLNSWKERVPGMEEKITRCWKGYNFDDLNELAKDGYIDSCSHNSKSVTFHEEGLKEAERLLAEYRIR
jgi:hypothetical protein